VNGPDIAQKSDLYAADIPHFSQAAGHPVNVHWMDVPQESDLNTMDIPRF
jgi:hypothetical protein